MLQLRNAVLKDRQKMFSVHKLLAWRKRIIRQIIKVKDVNFLLAASKEKTNKLRSLIRIIAKHNLYKKTMDTWFENLKQNLPLKTN